MKINDKHGPESDRSRGSPAVLAEMNLFSTLLRACRARRFRSLAKKSGHYGPTGGSIYRLKTLSGYSTTERVGKGIVPSEVINPEGS